MYKSRSTLERCVLNKKAWTVFISSSDRKGFFKELHISKKQLVYSGVGVALIFVFLLGFAVDYFFTFSSHITERNYQKENQELKSQLSHLQFRMAKLNTRLNQIEDFSYKIKKTAGLGLPSSTSSPWAIGPLSHPAKNNLHRSYSENFYASFSSSPSVPPSKVSEISSHHHSPSSHKEKAPLMSSLSGVDSVVIYMDRLEKKSHLLQEDITLLLEQLYEKKDILSSTPSQLPVKKGWISSHFGYRQYPFTGEVTLHEGMDIAAFPGTPVYAPAKGVVVFAGYKQGYGNVIVVDHGYELSTLYGHLSEIMVSPQQKINRGEVIGAVGNTGNSSGSHLHYEVRISNVPVDPSNYVLNTF